MQVSTTVMSLLAVSKEYIQRFWRGHQVAEDSQSVSLSEDFGLPPMIWCSRMSKKVKKEKAGSIIGTL